MAWTALVGSAMSMAAGVYSGQNAKQDASYNAARMEEQAGLARSEAALEARRVRDTGTRVVSTQTARTAASNVATGSGSPLLKALDTLRRSEEDAVLARWRGDLRAEGLVEEAANTRRQGRQTMIAHFLSGTAGAVKGMANYQYYSGGGLTRRATSPTVGEYAGWGLE